MSSRKIPSEARQPEPEESPWEEWGYPRSVTVERVAAPLRDEALEARPGRGEQDGWYNWLDYCGAATVYLRTQPIKAGEQCPVGDTAPTWSSELAIALHQPRPGTREGDAYEQLIDGTLHLGILNYVHLLSRPTPIGKKWSRAYKSREEAGAGHHSLLCYLQMFMEVRRLFHDIVAEMEQQRSAFLLGTPTPAATLMYTLLADN